MIDANKWPPNASEYLPEICKHLGLDGLFVVSIDMHFSADEIPMVTIKRELSKTEMDALFPIPGEGGRWSAQ